MLRDWLNTPEVVLWWGDPHEQYALVEGDLSDPRMAMHIVAFQGRPFAYVQDYETTAWPQPQFADLPPGARAMDTFIGVPQMLGQGHGAGYLRERALALIAEGAPLIAIDPDPENERAVGAYARAGFRSLGERPSEDCDTILLMVFDEATARG